MARLSLRWCFLLCVFLTVAVLLVIQMVSTNPVSTLLFTFRHPPHDNTSLQDTVPDHKPIQKTALEDKPIQVTFTQEQCPCRRDLPGVNVKGVPMEMETNDNIVIGFFQRYRLKVKRGLGHRREALDPEFEAPLFLHPPIYLAACLPDHRRSKVFLLTPHENISPGSTVQFRIDLYNGHGRPRCAGGDDVRAWLKSQDGRSSVAAKVKDLHNGSYVGETVLPWSGVTFVRVSLTYPQEFLRLSVELYHTFHAMRYTTETLSFDRFAERVPCLPSLPIPGYAKFCNFTDDNGGLPWYCGRPVTSQLNCSHRHLSGNLYYIQPLPIPPPLQQYVRNLHKCCENPKNANLRLIPNKIKLKTRPEVTPPAPQYLPPCSTLPRRDSWLSPCPSGWLRDGQWIPSNCTLPDFTEDTVQRCLANKTVMLLGDSNQRILWQAILPLVGCSVMNQPAWNAPHVCVNDYLRSSLLYATHAMPFSPGTHGGAPVANLPLPVALDLAQKLSYPDTQDLVVVVHYYMHLSTHPVQAYRNFVQAARQTVQEYLKTHPKVKFVMRGPHMSYQANNFQTHCGDKFAHWYRRIWQEEFAELRDRVWFMDIWDLTVASENVKHHPEPVLSEIARILLGYICDGL